MKKYFAPTPIVFRKIGDAILILTVAMSGMIPSLPLDDNKQKWVMFGISTFGVLGKILTNFFSDSTNEDSK